MSISATELRTIPLFQDITDEHLSEFVAAFERVELKAGEVLFDAGSQPTHLYLLAEGEIALREGTDTAYTLHPLAPIGELGAVSGYVRNTTATATRESVLFRIGRQELIEFFEANGDVAFPFYHNLTNVLADKIRRDTRRLEEMRTNLIRTQKKMKEMRDVLMEAEDNPTNQTLFEALQSLIDQNRRTNYLVQPPDSLPAHVRLADGTQVAVRELSGVWLVLPASSAIQADSDGHWSGVLVTRRYEIPVSGNLSRPTKELVKIELDLLIDEYAAQLDDYLTRVQMLDVVV